MGEEVVTRTRQKVCFSVKGKELMIHDVGCNFAPRLPMPMELMREYLEKPEVYVAQCNRCKPERLKEELEQYWERPEVGREDHPPASSPHVEGGAGVRTPEGVFDGDRRAAGSGAPSLPRVQQHVRDARGGQEEAEEARVTLETTVETVTPELAEEFLRHNGTNRSLRPRLVERYAADMRAGNWYSGGSTIDFDTEGRLLNGQHRLHACLLAGVPFQTVVVRGVDSEAQRVMDVGAKRTFADQLGFLGFTQTTLTAAAVALQWRWVQHCHTPLKFSQNSYPTHSQAMDVVERNPSIRESVAVGQSVGRALTGSQSAYAVFYHQAALVDGPAADQFVEKLREGAMLAKGDAVLALRNWVMNRRGDARGVPNNNVQYLALCVKAWNAWVLGQERTILRWNPYGPLKEEFPTMVDLVGAPVLSRHER